MKKRSRNQKADKRTVRARKPARGSAPEAAPPESLLFEALLAHAEDMIYFKDRNSRLIKFSRAMATRIGFDDPATLVGLTDHEIFTAEHAEQAARDEAEILRTGQPMINKIEKETWPDGRITWVSTTKLPLRGPDGIILGTFGISRDVTRQHLAEENLRRVAQELRNQNAIYENDLRLASDLFELFAGQAPARIPEEVRKPALFHLASHYQPAAGKLGGDFFVVFQRGEHVRIMVCDVMGHGVQSALVAVMLRTWARQLSDECDSPAAWLTGLNTRLSAQFLDCGNCFTATAFACDLNTHSGQFTFSCAGHPPPLLRRAIGAQMSEVFTRRSQGAGLGLFHSSVYNQNTDRLAAGDCLVIYTDGLIEAKNAEGLEFDISGAKAAVAGSAGKPAAETLECIRRAAANHTRERPPDDDTCILVIERAAG